jgi:long-chain acyl-CoA synthetase
VKKVVTTQLGDLLGFPKSLIVNWVVKHRKKMVPAWNIPGTVTFKTVLSQGKGRSLAEPALTHDDIAFLQYTGGTTGVSKGAMLTHGNIVSNLQQVSAWIGTGLKEGGELVITALPMYHIFALTGSCLTNIKIGAHNVLITNPRDMPGFVKELGQVPLHVHVGREHALRRAHEHARVREPRLLGLKLTLGGGMAGAARGGRPLEEHHGCPPASRPTGSPETFAGRLHQPARPRVRIQRHAGPADPVDRASPSATTTAASSRWARRARSASRARR